MRTKQRVTYFLLEHRWLALLLTFAITFVPVLGVLGILYAGFVTFRKGVLQGGLFAIAATLPYAISFMLTVPPEAINQFMLWLVFGVAVSSNILTFLFAVMLSRHATWSQILQVAALLGVLVISVIHLVYPNVVDWWGAELTQLATIIKPDVRVAASVQAEAIKNSQEIATGFITAMVLLNALLQLVVVRWWLASVYSHGLLRRELHFIRLSPLAGILFVLSLGLSFYGNSVVIDVMPVVYLLFAVAGLSLLHYLFALMKSATRLFWILLMYVTFIFILPTSLFLLAFIALTDVWLDVRGRLTKAKI